MEGQNPWKPAKRTNPWNVKEEDLRHGLYQHYKGGIYYVLFPVWMNDMLEGERVRGILYYSIEKTDYNTRAFAHEKLDSFTDEVLIESKWVPRFRRLSPAELVQRDTEIKKILQG